MPPLGLKKQREKVVSWSLNESSAVEGEPPNRSASRGGIQPLPEQ